MFPGIPELTSLALSDYNPENQPAKTWIFFKNPFVVLRFHWRSFTFISLLSLSFTLCVRTYLVTLDTYPSSCCDFHYPQPFDLYITYHLHWQPNVHDSRHSSTPSVCVYCLDMSLSTMFLHDYIALALFCELKSKLSIHCKCCFFGFFVNCWTDPEILAFTLLPNYFCSTMNLYICLCLCFVMCCSE